MKLTRLPVFILCFALSASGVLAADKKKSSSSESSPKRVRELLANAHTDYAAKWKKTASSGSPDDYLAAARGIREEAEHFGDLIVEMFYPKMKKADHFRLYDMRPWITHMDIGERAMTVMPGCDFSISPYELFDEPLPASERGGPTGGVVAVIKLDDEEDGPHCEITGIECKPAWPMRTDAVICKWFTHPPSNKKIGFTCQPIWIHVPENTPPGNVTLTLTAKGKGPKDGKAAAEIAVSEKITLTIAAAAPQTRSQALGLWAQAVCLSDKAKTSADSPRRPAWQEEQRLIHAKLKAAADAGGEHGRFVAALLAHAEYQPPPDEEKGNVSAGPAKSSEADTSSAKPVPTEPVWPLVFKSDDGKSTLELRAIRFGMKEALRSERNQFNGQETSVLPIRIHRDRERLSDTLLVALTFTEGSGVFVNLKPDKRCCLATAKGKKHPVRGLGVIDEGKEVCEFNPSDANEGQVGWLLGGKGSVVALAFDIPADLTKLRLSGLGDFSKITFNVPALSAPPASAVQPGRPASPPAAITGTGD